MKNKGLKTGKALKIASFGLAALLLSALALSAFAEDGPDLADAAAESSEQTVAEDPATEEAAAPEQAEQPKGEATQEEQAPPAGEDYDGEAEAEGPDTPQDPDRDAARAQTEAFAEIQPADVPFGTGYLQFSDVVSNNAVGYATNAGNTAPLALKGNFAYTATTPAEGVDVAFTFTNEESLKYPGTQYYFEAANVLDLPSGVTVKSNTTSGDTVTVVLNFKGNVNDSGNFAINYPFNSSFNGWVPNATRLGEISIASDALVGEVGDIEVTSAAQTDLWWRHFSFVPDGDIAAGGAKVLAANTRLMDRAINTGDALQWKLEPGSEVKVVLEYPAGTVVTGTKPDSASGYTTQDGVRNGNSIEWFIGNATSNGWVESGYWTGTSYTTMHMAWSAMSIAFPQADFPPGTTINDLKMYVEFTPFGQPSQKLYADIDPFDIVDATYHIQENSFVATGHNPVVSINNPESRSPEAGYGNIINAGGLPVPNTLLTWYNDIEKPARPSRLLLHNRGALFKYQVVITWNDGSTDTLYSAEASSIGTYYTMTLPNIAGRFIEKLEIYPLNNPDDTKAQLEAGTATPVRALPVDADVRVHLQYCSWEDAMFPTGKAISHGDYSNTKMVISWDEEDDEASHTSPKLDTQPQNGAYSVTYSDVEVLRVYYGLNAAFPNVSYTDVTSGQLSPGGTVSASVRFYNSSGLARDPWTDQRFIIVPPDVLTVDTAQKPTITNLNGAGFGTATITEMPLDNGRVAYEVIPDSQFSVNASNGSAAQTYQFTLQFTIKYGTPAGTYNLATRPIPSYQNDTHTNGMIFGTTQGVGNNLLRRETGGASNSNYWYDDSTMDLDNNPDTTHLYCSTWESFTVAPVQDLKVSASLQNKETNEWQGVENGSAKATVPLEGTGAIRLELTNSGNSYVGDLSLLDILPRVGDETAKDPTVAKNSQWDATLKGLQVAVYDADGNKDTAFTAADYTVAYDRSNDPSHSAGITRTGGAAFGANATTNMAEAGSFLFKLANGYRLPPGHTISIETTVEAPGTATAAQIGQEAYNAFAVSATHYQAATGATSYGAAPVVEPAKQTFVLAQQPTAQILHSGHAFKDYDLSDTYSAVADALYGGLTVELHVWDAATQAVGASGPVDTTTTDGSGQFAFTGLYAGDYVVKIVPPTGGLYSLAAKGNTADSAASHADGDGYLPPVTLAANGTETLAYNVGVQAATTLAVQYTLNGSNFGTPVALLADVGLASDGTLAGSAAPGTTAGLAIPTGYRLEESESASKTYTLSWDAPRQTLNFALEKDENRLVFNKSYPDAEGEIDDIVLKLNDSASLPTGGFTRFGYSLAGWTTNENDKDTKLYDLGESYTLASRGDVTFYAVWQAQPVAIVFDANGGTAPVGGSTTGSYGGTVASAAATSRAGYSFQGWRAQGQTADWIFANEAGATTLTTANGVVESGGAFTLTLVAQWKAGGNTTYTVEHYKQRADGSYPATASDIDTGLAGETAQKAAYAPKNYAGYSHAKTTFASTGNPEGTAELAIAGDGSLVVRLYYTYNLYTLRFDARGGAPTPADQKLMCGAKASQPTAPTLEGHSFVGWYTAATGGAKWDFGKDTMPARDTTLYARYAVIGYNVTFAYGGAPIADKKTPVEYGALVPQPTQPEWAGHSFGGWADEDGGAWDFAKDTMPARNITLTARWDTQLYTVRFEDWNGAELDTQQVAWNTDATPPASPARGGYRFTGWKGNYTNVIKDEVVVAQYRGVTSTPGGESSTGTTAPPPASGRPVPPASARSSSASATAPSLASSFASSSQGGGAAAVASAPEYSSAPSAVVTPPADQGGEDLPAGGDERLALQTGNPFVDIANGNVPLGGLLQAGAWSLLNLLLAVLALVGGLLLVLTGLRRRKAEQGDGDGEPEAGTEPEGQSRGKNRFTLLRTLSIVAGFATTLLFVILENLTQPMVWINRWTPLILCVFVLHVVLNVLQALGQKRGEEEEENRYTEAEA